MISMIPKVSEPDQLADSPSTTTVPTSAPIPQPNAIRVNLRDYGFSKAGEHHGDAGALANLFNQIRQGFVLDENANDEKQQHEKVDVEIDAISQTVSELQTEIRRINESKIPKVEGAVALVDDDIHDIQINTLKAMNDPRHVNRFNLGLYWAVFVPATLFLILFYVSAFHSGFYRDVIGEVQQADNGNVNGVLNAIFNRSAFTELNLHWLSPVVFFVFGLILHIAFESPGRGRWLKVISVLLFILLADGFLAYFIEDKSHQVKVLMAMEGTDYHFYTSAVFYMVLILGYCTCLGWSIILHQIKEERGKLDIEKVAQIETRIRKEKRLVLTNQIQDLKALLLTHQGKIEGLNNTVDQLRRKRERISLSLSDLHKRITDFYDGWLSYVNLRGRDNSALKTDCHQTLQNFYADHLPRINLN